MPSLVRIIMSVAPSPLRSAISGFAAAVCGNSAKAKRCPVSTETTAKLLSPASKSGLSGGGTFAAVIRLNKALWLVSSFQVGKLLERWVPERAHILLPPEPWIRWIMPLFRATIISCLSDLLPKDSTTSGLIESSFFNLLTLGRSCTLPQMGAEKSSSLAGIPDKPKRWQSRGPDSSPPFFFSASSPWSRPARSQTNLSSGLCVLECRAT
mmetsp:Transcript_14620/g.36760  ORF Transcript_14620/g.36760 Transcript_14620/m.36760 type:complete len:210 (+) Transcript_14620:210-839(+)